MLVIPSVLHFIVCNSVEPNPHNLQSYDVIGLTWSIRSTSVPPFPALARRLTILAIFMGGEGETEFSIRLVQDDTRLIISDSFSPHSIRFVGDPNEVSGMKIRLPDCNFPRPGLYWVQLVFEGVVVARQPIRVYAEA